MLSLPNNFVKVGDGYINLSHISRIEIVPAENPQLKLLINKDWVFVSGAEAVNFLHWINGRFLIPIPQGKATTGRATVSDLDMDIWGQALAGDDDDKN